MKIIHCADFHLDSAMTSNLDLVTARIRRGEILRNFERMVGYASSQGVEAILLAGDIFDTSSASELTRNTLLHCVVSNPGISFFYIRGNHDEHFSLESLSRSGKTPFNLMFFGNGWTCYECGGVAVYGAELSGAKDGLYDGLNPDPDKINIVMLHGQISEYPDKVEYGIDINRLRGKNIDYLALGHIHYHSEGILDDRGIYCYSGCPEGRGFDECDGEHGFMLLEADQKKRVVSGKFIPFERRRHYCVTADVTGCMTTSDIIGVCSHALDEAGCGSSSLVKLTLSGSLDAECEKDISYISGAFADKYFFLKLEDKTKVKIYADDYLLDESLKGEFVRTVFADGTLSDEDKAAIVSFGFKALAGEEAF